MATNMFFSTLDGQTFRDIQVKIFRLDRSLTSYEDRLKEVNKLIDETENPYLINYFSNYYDCHLLQNDNLSNENNICNLVEMLTNYLLMSDDGRELESRQKTYYIDSNKINRMHDKPVNINDNQNTMVVSFNKENYKLDKKQKITAEDLKEDSYCGSVLRQYQDLIDKIDFRLRNGIGNQIKDSKAKHEINQDMLLAKNQIRGVYGYNIDSKESHGGDQYTSLSEPETIKKMFTTDIDTRDKPSASTWLLSLDFEQLLKDVPLSTRDRQISILYRNGYTMREIAEFFDMAHSTIVFTIKKIINSMARFNSERHVQHLKDKYYL